MTVKDLPGCQMIQSWFKSSEENVNLKLNDTSVIHSQQHIWLWFFRTIILVIDYVYD